MQKLLRVETVRTDFRRTTVTANMVRVASLKASDQKNVCDFFSYIPFKKCPKFYYIRTALSG